MKHTRFRLGKLWKEGKTTGDYEKYYLEFQAEIDESLKTPEAEKKKNSDGVDSIGANDQAFIDKEIERLRIKLNISGEAK